MAKERKTQDTEVSDPSSAQTADPVVADAAPAAAPPNTAAPHGPQKYFAQRRILHGDRIISKGEEIPPGLREDSLALLLKAGDIGEAPPQPTVISGKPAQ